jgi:transcription elongation factor Elf1
MATGSTINDKMGLRPKTRTRTATHGRSLSTTLQCPKCPGRHVVTNEIHGRRLRLCGFCGHLWEA